MSHREYNKEPDFNAYRKNALCSLQKIASEANAPPKNLTVHPKKNIIVESPYFSFEQSSSSRQDHPQFNSSVQSSFLQPSVILNSIKNPNEDDGWVFIKNADDNEKEIEVKREGRSDDLQSYEILRKGGESVEGYNGKRINSKSYKENHQISNKHHLEDDDVYLFL